jgi:large subunit ribosomal protein L29
MSKQTPRQLREMVDADLTARIDELRKSLFNLRTRAATKDLDNVGRIKLEKRELARILTILRERGIEL